MVDDDDDDDEYIYIYIYIILVEIVRSGVDTSFNGFDPFSLLIGFEKNEDSTLSRKRYNSPKRGNKTFIQGFGLKKMNLFLFDEQQQFPNPSIRAGFNYCVLFQF